MASKAKRLSLGIFLAVVIIIVAGAAFVLVADLEVLRTPVEAAASKALGMEVKINGHTGLDLIPFPALAVEEVSVSNSGMDVLSADRLGVSVELMPLLRREVKVRSFSLTKPVITIEKVEKDRYNFQSRKVAPEGKEAPRGLPMASLERMTVRDGTVIYSEKGSELKATIRDIDLTITDLSFAGSGADVLRDVRFAGRLKFKEARRGDMAVSDLEASLQGRDGVINLEPVSLVLFGARGRGSLKADFKGEVPGYQIALEFSKIPLGELSKLYPQLKAAEGEVDLSANLSMSGSSAEEMRKSLKGRLSIKSKEITITGPSDEKAEKPVPPERAFLKGVDLSLEELGFRGNSGGPLREVFFAGSLGCREIMMRGSTISKLDGTLGGRQGVFSLEPLTMDAFGAKGEGSLRADLAGDVPVFRVKYRVPGMPVEKLLKMFTEKKVAEGKVDFSADLRMEGASGEELKKTLDGQVLMEGEGIKVFSYDLDKLLTDMAQSQQVSLFDAGAYFLAGPLGPAITKGYDFASVYKETRGGEGDISKLMVDVRIEDGVASARDVAFATRRNRMAMKGALDIPREELRDVTIAVLDGKGCAMMSQRVTGSLHDPKFEKVSIVRSLAGPLLDILKKTQKVVTLGDCKVFYDGAVKHPG